MQTIVNFLAAKVRIRVECAYPERFLNLCAQHYIAFWDLVRLDEITVEVSMGMRAYKRLSPLMDSLHAEVRCETRVGGPVVWGRIRKRYILLVGFLLVLTVTWVMSLYIWDIQVVGNDAVPRAVILRVLDDHGVGIGTFGPGVEPESLRNQVLLQLEDLSWITVNVSGSRATVIVRERIHPPRRVPEGVPTAVYATRDGIVDEMVIWGGAPLVEIGDTIEMGQDIITGRVESLALGTGFVRADARVYARTWHSLSMSMPLEVSEKVFTGESSTKSTIFFGESGINLFFDSGISHTSYDKIVEQANFVLPGGIVLPIRYERRIYREYEINRSMLDETRAALLLQELLLDRLKARVGPQGEILRTHFRVEVADGLITVHLEAECREQVAAVRQMREEELVVTPPPEADAEEE